MNIFLSSCTSEMTQAAINEAVAIAKNQITLNADYVTEDKDATVGFGEDINGEYVTFRTSYCRSQKAPVCVVKNSNSGGGYMS